MDWRIIDYLFSLNFDMYAKSLRSNQHERYCIFAKRIIFVSMHTSTCLKLSMITMTRYDSLIRRRDAGRPSVPQARISSTTRETLSSIMQS